MVIIQRLVKGISSGIDLASEAVAHNKDKKEAERQQSEVEHGEHSQPTLSDRAFPSADKREKEDDSSPESDSSVDNDDED